MLYEVITQLEDAKLQEDEQVELEEEQKALAHAEEIKTELTTAQYLLDDEKAVLPMLKETMAAIGKIKDYLPHRITSYNVCYTKLLRAQPVIHIFKSCRIKFCSLGNRHYF